MIDYFLLKKKLENLRTVINIITNMLEDRILCDLFSLNHFRGQLYVFFITVNGIQMKRKISQRFFLSK